MIASASNTATERVVSLHGDFKPLGTQFAFTSSPHRIKAYVGAMGSGKSEILCRTCIDISSRLPGSRGVIGRYTFRDFQRTTRETMDRVLLPDIVERQLPGGDG